MKKLPGFSLLISALFSLHLSANDQDLPQQAQLSLEDIRTFTEVFAQIRENYIQSVDDKTLLNAAINGMLESLDPHSAYLQGRAFQSLDDDARGRYGGIGVQVDIEQNRLVIGEVFANGPAAAAGVKPGDWITRIDGTKVSSKSIRRDLAKLRGKPGSEIRLRFKRPKQRQPLDLILTRAFIPLPAVQTRLLENAYGYLQLLRFQQDSGEAVIKALKELQTQHQLRGFILDLRNNPGGVFQPAISIADAFLEEGVIVTTRSRNAEENIDFTATEGDVTNGAPLLVLVNGNTASAAEILAGALQDHGRALVIGQPSFGKGSVQSVLPLSNGNALKLTTARYYTPNGRSIQATGIHPNVEVNSVRKAGSGQLREADLEQHLNNDTPSEATDPTFERVDATQDYVLFQALNLLKGISLLGNPPQSDKATE